MKKLKKFSKRKLIIFETIFAVDTPKMGLKKRGKFERVFTDSEDNESTDLESGTKSPEKISEISTDFQESENTNNSNTESTGMDQSKRSQNEKFLITRSKRKYTKREMPEMVKLTNNSEKISDKSQQDNEGEESVPKRKRETIKSLDNKIQEANNFLLTLNKKLEDREEEIKGLKRVISSDRAGTRLSEVEQALKRGDTSSIPAQAVLHDFPLIGEEESDSDSIQLDLHAMDDLDDEEMGEKSNKRRRERSRSNEKRNRKRSRKSSRSRSRSRSRNWDEVRRQYKDNPAVQDLVKELVAKQVKEEMEKRSKTDKSTVPGKELSFLPCKVNRSPSDAILYTPAVARKDNLNLTGTPPPTNSRLSNFLVGVSTDNKSEFSTNNRIDDSINETLSQLRLISDEKRRRSEGGHTEQNQQQMRDAKRVAENAILDAERFRARIQQPNRGMEIKFNNNSPNAYKKHRDRISPYKQVPMNQDELRAMRYLDQEDDEFFHTTCHVEDAMKEKIEKGKFVELEKLIQKRILQYGFKEETRMQLVNKDGVSYFVPSVDKETRIDNVRKWEQAFRIYTTIYCKANPTRAGEILQYVDIIHRAAAIFNWDNVAKYDYVFRQLMAANPHRSWAKVYTQMWNITLNEPIKKFNENGNHNGGVQK